MLAGNASTSRSAKLEQLTQMLQQFHRSGRVARSGEIGGIRCGGAQPGDVQQYQAQGCRAAGEEEHAADEEAWRLKPPLPGSKREFPSAVDGIVSTGIPALDGLLPSRGLRPGSLVEWLTASSGSGAGTLAFTAVRPWLQAAGRDELPGACVLIEAQPRFYPPALAALGLSLEQLILVQPQSVAETLWAAEQSLRCPGVSLVWVHVGRCADRVLRRLQLAAEAGGGLGLLFRPWEARQQRSWAEVRLAVSSLPAGCQEEGGPEERGPGGRARRLRVERLYGRGCTETSAIELNIHDETGAVSVVSQLADSALAAQRLRA